MLPLSDSGGMAAALPETLTAPFGAVRDTSGLDCCGQLAGFKEAK